MIGTLLKLPTPALFAIVGQQFGKVTKVEPLLSKGSSVLPDPDAGPDHHQQVVVVQPHGILV